MRYYVLATSADRTATSVPVHSRTALAALFGELDRLGPDPAIEHLRQSPPEQDADGRPRWTQDGDGKQEPTSGEGSSQDSGQSPSPEHTGTGKRPGKGRRPRSVGVRYPQQATGRRPTHAEVEHRVASLQLWLAQRLPIVVIRERAQADWGVASTYTVDKYIRLARSRMVEELIDNRLVHQAEQIYALMDCARRAAEAEQFSAAVGAHRVIAEISGMLRAPIKPPGERP